VIFFPLSEDAPLEGGKKPTCFWVVTPGLFGIKRAGRKAESSSGTATADQGRQEVGILCLLNWGEKKLNRGMAKNLLLGTSE